MPKEADAERRVPLVTLLRRLASAIVDELVERLRAAGYPDISAAHHPVFYNIDAEGTRLTELAARAGMTHQSMGELVDALCRLGYLERAPDPSDGRARLARLTDRGAEAVARARLEVAEIEAGWLARFGRVGVEVDLRVALAAALREYRR